MAQKKTRATFRNLVMSSEVETSLTMSQGQLQPETSTDSSVRAGLAFPLGITRGLVRHVYVHIPFCARICPYCAFYKELLDRSQTSRFCEALLRELELNESHRRPGDRRFLLRPSTIYFGGGTPTALNI